MSKTEFKVGDIVDLRDLGGEWVCGVYLDEIDKDDKETPYCYDGTWYSSIRKHVKKMLTMQEYADKYGVYVAMDKDGCIYSYKEKPMRYKINWNTVLRTVVYINGKVQKPTCDWRDSLCAPKQATVDNAVAHSPKLYHTPCGDFMEGETINLGLRTDNYIFISYAPTLIKPYICVCRFNRREYKNRQELNLKQFDKISKLTAKKYEPYTEPNFEWIGKKVALRAVYKNSDIRTIDGFQMIDGTMYITFENYSGRSFKECFEQLEWIDDNGSRTPFGKEIKYESK